MQFIIRKISKDFIDIDVKVNDTHIELGLFNKKEASKLLETLKEVVSELETNTDKLI
jgi:hypothetical protein